MLYIKYVKKSTIITNISKFKCQNGKMKSGLKNQICKYEKVSLNMRKY